MAQSIDDVVLDNNVVENTRLAINTRGEALGNNCVVRGTKLINVKTLIDGPGATRFTIIP